MWSSPRLLRFDQVPLWMRDNDFVRTGYRPQPSTILSCLNYSLLTFTNDTLNIYTHLLGFIVLLPFTIYLLGPALSLPSLPSLPPCPNPLPAALSNLRQHGLSAACASAATLRAFLHTHRLALAPLAVTALLCLLFSALYHTFWILSPRAQSTLVRLDFFGIALLCLGHSLTGLHYTFYCDPHTASFYYVLVLSGFLCTLPVIFSKHFASASARTVRGLVFGGLGSVVLFPLLKAALSIREYADLVAVAGALASLTCYGVGAFMYISRFPECCRVGMHDRFLSSHQLMHMSVLFGVAIHLGACYYLQQLRLNYGCSLSPFSNH